MGNFGSAHKAWLNGVPVGMLLQTYREYKADLDFLSQESRAARRGATKVSPVSVQRMLKTNHAAAYLGISPWKLRNFVQSGEISYIAGDGTGPWLFDKLELDRWIETRKVKL